MKEVREGFECGIRLKRFNDVREGDLLEAYRVEEVKRTLEQAEAEAKAADQARELAALEAEALGDERRRPTPTPPSRSSASSAAAAGADSAAVTPGLRGASASPPHLPPRTSTLPPRPLRWRSPVNWRS